MLHQKKRLLGNIGANAYGQLVTIAVQLFAVPFFLHAWSMQRYGEWLVLSSVPAAFSLADLGFGSVGSNKMAMLSARSEWSEVGKVLHTMIGFMSGVGFVLLGVIAASALFCPWTWWLKLQLTTETEARQAIFWLGVFGIASLFGTVIQGMYRAALYTACGVYLLNTTRAIVAAAGVVTASLSDNLSHVAMVTALTQISCFLAMFWGGGRILHQVQPGIGDFDRSELREMMRPAFAFMLFPTGNAIYFQGMSLVVNGVLGASGVVVFNTVRTLTRVVAQAVIVLKNSAWPEFSHLIGAGRLAEARQLHRSTVEGSLLLTVALSAMLLLCGKWLMHWWTHGAVTVGTATLLAFISTVTVNGLWSTSSGVVQAVNRHEGVACRFAIASVLSIPLAYVLTRHFGINGAALAMFLVELSLLPFVLVAACKAVGDTVPDFLCALAQVSTSRQMGASLWRSFAKRV